MKHTLSLVLICFFISACIKTDLQFVATDQLQAVINVSNSNNQKTAVTVDFKHPEYSYFKLAEGEQLLAQLSGEQKQLTQKIIGNDLFSTEFDDSTELQTLTLDYIRPAFDNASASITLPALSYLVAPLPPQNFSLNDNLILHWAPAGLSDTLELKADISCNTEFTEDLGDSAYEYLFIDLQKKHPGWLQGKKQFTFTRQLDDTGTATIAIQQLVKRHPHYSVELIDSVSYNEVKIITVTADLKALSCHVKKLQLARSKTGPVSTGFSGGKVTASSSYYYPKTLSVSF